MILEAIGCITSEKEYHHVSVYNSCIHLIYDTILYCIVLHFIFNVYY